jgi:hypothetical protein
LGGDAGFVDLFAGSHLVDEDKSELGDHIEKAVLLSNHQSNRKIAWSRGIVHNLIVLFEFRHSFRRGRYFSDVDGRLGLSSLALSKAEDIGVVGVVVEQDSAECASMAFQQLLLASFNQVKLDMSIDGLSSVGSRYSEQCTPLAIGTQHVSDNLAFLQIARTIKYLHFLLFRLGDTHMKDRGCGHNSEDIVSYPTPENDVLGKFNVGKFLFLVHVEYLQDVSLPGVHRSLQGNNVLLEVHDGAIYLCTWSANQVELVEEFDDSELGYSLLVRISDGNVALGLKVGDVELEELRIDAQVSEVLDLSGFEWCGLHLNQIK